MACDRRCIAEAFQRDVRAAVGRQQLFLENTHTAVDRVVSGWTVASIASLQTGFPFSPQLGYNPTASGDTRNAVRPDRNPNFHSSLYTSGDTARRAVLQPRGLLLPSLRHLCEPGW